MNRPKKQRFQLGQVVATPAALEALEQAGQSPQTYLNRHAVGDWGEIDQDDWLANDSAIVGGERLLSAYTLAGLGTDKLWVLTEADRSVTTLLLSSQY